MKAFSFLIIHYRGWQSVSHDLDLDHWKKNLYFFGEIVGGCELGTGAAEVSQGLDRQPRVANHRHQTEGV